MRIFIKSPKVLMVTILVLSAILPLCGAAQAAWYINSGNCGRVLNENDPCCNVTYHGWGINIELLPECSTWVQFPIQFKDTAAVRRIGIIAKNTVAWIRIVHVHIWSGQTKLHEFNDIWWGTNFIDTLILTLPSTIPNLLSLNVAVFLDNPSWTTNDTFTIYQIGVGN